MKRVSTVDFIRNFGVCSDSALAAPIMLTKNGRDRLVFISIERYNKLKNASGAFAETQINAKSHHVGRTPARAKKG